VPVVNSRQENRLIGSMPRAEALASLSEMIAVTTTTIASTEFIAKEKLTPQPPSPGAK